MPVLAQAPVRFDVATVKPSPAQPEGTTSVRMSSDEDTGNLSYSHVNAKDVIARAYGIQKYQITGPDWLESERFDIVAKFAAPVPRKQIGLMLRDLLAERFGMTFHHDTKELPVYLLTVDRKVAKLKSIDVESGISSNSNGRQWHVVAKVPMTGLAEFLTSVSDRLVIDKTGLSGVYEMALEWTNDGAGTGSDSASLPSLFTALPEQLGLRLVSSKAPVDMIVVDKINRTPAPN